jgi:hypothetical protein
VHRHLPDLVLNLDLLAALARQRQQKLHRLSQQTIEFTGQHLRTCL